ncbi:hypothetical protein JOM56_015007 [Amanita muscaria]
MVWSLWPHHSLNRLGVILHTCLQRLVGLLLTISKQIHFLKNRMRWPPLLLLLSAVFVDVDDLVDLVQSGPSPSYIAKAHFSSWKVISITAVLASSMFFDRIIPYSLFRL